MKQQFRLLVALAAALIAILATGNALANMPDNSFGTVGSADDGSYLVEVGRGVSVTQVVAYYDKIYREATKDDTEPNGEPLTWGVIHAANEGHVIPYCSHPKNGPRWLPTRSTIVWNDCDEKDRSIILVAGPSGRIKVPVKAVESFAQMQARLVELDAFVKSLGCKRSDVACLRNKVGSGSTPSVPPVPPVAKKSSATPPQTPIELKADNERLTEANEILASSITELTKKIESFTSENVRLAKANALLVKTNEDLQDRPSTSLVYTIVGVGVPGILLVGLLLGFAITALGRPKVAPVPSQDPMRQKEEALMNHRGFQALLKTQKETAANQLADAIKRKTEELAEAIQRKTEEANRVNAELATASAAAILEEKKARENAEKHVKELEPQKSVLERILVAVGLADAAYNTLAFADNVANAFGGSLIEDRHSEEPGARDKLRERFTAAMKDVYDAIGRALHRDGDYVAALFSSPRTVHPAASQTPPTSAVPSSGGGFEAAQLATLPGGLKPLPPPEFPSGNPDAEDSGIHPAPSSDPGGDAALSEHAAARAAGQPIPVPVQPVTAPKTITLPWSGESVPLSTSGASQESPPGNGSAGDHPKPSDDLEPGRISKIPTWRPGVG